MVDRLQQAAFGLHQPVSQCPSGRFPEITALGVLRMRPAADQTDACIRQFCPGQNARKRLMTEGVQNQILPVSIQGIFRAAGLQHDSAARRKGFQNQMNLGVMAKRFKMADSLHLFCDSLLINKLSFLRTGPKSKTLQKQSFQHFSLHPSREADTDSVPAGPRRELRQLLAQLSELFQQGYRVLPAFKAQDISPNGFHALLLYLVLFAENTAGRGSGKAEQAADLPCFRPLDRLIPCPGVDSDSADLFLPEDTVRGPILQRIPYGQTAAGNLDLCQPLAPGVPADLIA